MGYYSVFDAFSRLHTADLVQVTREDAGNFLIYLPIPGEANPKVKARWRLRIINDAWHMAGLAITNTDGVATLPGPASTIVIQDHTSKYEYTGRYGKAGDPDPMGADGNNPFAFVGGVHDHQDGQSMTLMVDGKSITSLPTGTSAWGYTVVMTQTINGLYPADNSTVMFVTTLTHTITASSLQMDAVHVVNSAQSWERYNGYGCMGPVQVAHMDTYQVEGFSPATAVGDGNWKQSGTQATWCEFSDSSEHTYWMRVAMPSGGPNLDGSWTYSDALLAGVQDRADGIIKFYAFLDSAAYSGRRNVAGQTFSSRSVYTVGKAA